MSKRDVKAPCVKVCKFDPAGVCRGCFRTRAEIRAWKRLADDEKAAINRRVRPLIAAARTGEAKRRRKLDKKIRKLETRLAALRAERDALVALEAAKPLAAE